MPTEAPKKKVVIGIVIDAYKLSLFEKRLTGNYFYVNAGLGPIKDTILLKVETDNVQVLAQLVALTNKQAVALGRSNLT